MTEVEAKKQLEEAQVEVKRLQKELEDRGVADTLTENAKQLNTEQTEFHNSMMDQLRDAQAAMMRALSSSGSSFEFGPQAKIVIETMKENPGLVPKIREFTQNLLDKYKEEFEKFLKVERPFNEQSNTSNDSG